MKRSALLVLATSIATLAFAQAPAPKLSFEVASIKPSGPIDPEKIRSGQQKIGMSVDNARVDLAQSPLIGIILQAYKPLQLFQVSGPPFLMTDRFDIVAKMPEGATKEQVPELLKSLLADRFGLKYHMETKDHAAYILTQAKGGAKLTAAGEVAATVDEDTRNKPAEKGETVMNAGDSQVRMKTDSKGGMTATVKGGQNGTVKQTMTPEGMIKIEIESMTIEELCGQLSILLTKPVVDHTGLKGKYSMTMEFSRDDIMAAMKSLGVDVGANGGGGGAAAGGSGANASPAAAASDPVGGSSTIVKSMERLGLHLEAGKAPVPMMIIDHVEKTPTDN